MESSDLSRLAPSDPWTIVAEGRAQQGPIVTSRLAALIARTRRPGADAAAGHGNYVMSPRALRNGWHSARAMAPIMVSSFVAFLFRNVNGVAVPYVMHDLGFGADRLGLLTGVYVLAFTAAQLPVGALLACARMTLATAGGLTAGSKASAD